MDHPLAALLRTELYCSLEELTAAFDALIQESKRNGGLGEAEERELNASKLYLGNKCIFGNRGRPLKFQTSCDDQDRHEYYQFEQPRVQKLRQCVNILIARGKCLNILNENDQQALFAERERICKRFTELLSRTEWVVAEKDPTFSHMKWKAHNFRFPEYVKQRQNPDATYKSPRTNANPQLDIHVGKSPRKGSQMRNLNQSLLTKSEENILELTANFVWFTKAAIRQDQLGFEDKIWLGKMWSQIIDFFKIKLSGMPHSEATLRILPRRSQSGMERNVHEAMSTTVEPQIAKLVTTLTSLTNACIDLGKLNAEEESSLKALEEELVHFFTCGLFGCPPSQINTYRNPGEPFATRRKGGAIMSRDGSITASKPALSPLKNLAGFDGAATIVNTKRNSLEKLKNPKLKQEDVGTPLTSCCIDASPIVDLDERHKKFPENPTGAVLPLPSTATDLTAANPPSDIYLNHFRETAAFSKAAQAGDLWGSQPKAETSRHSLPRTKHEKTRLYDYENNKEFIQIDQMNNDFCTLKRFVVNMMDLWDLQTCHVPVSVQRQEQLFKTELEAKILMLIDTRYPIRRTGSFLEILSHLVLEMESIYLVDHKVILQFLLTEAKKPDTKLSQILLHWSNFYNDYYCLPAND